jgi:hypothetical protein
MHKPALAITRRAALVVAAGAALAPPALAHRAQTVLSTVEWNAGLKGIDVAHRLHAHDSELALAASGVAGTVDLTVIQDQARLALYCEERFKLEDAAGAVPLVIVGVELEGDMIHVYQESLRAGPSPEITITNGILRDVFDQQTNLVNVRMGVRTRTLIFSGRDGAKSARDLL